MLSTTELLCLAAVFLFTSYNHISDHPMSYNVAVERGKAFLDFFTWTFVLQSCSMSPCNCAFTALWNSFIFFKYVYISKCLHSVVGAGRNGQQQKSLANIFNFVFHHHDTEIIRKLTSSLNIFHV